MFANIENWLMNNMLGKIAVSVGSSVAAYAASGHLGAAVTLDPAQVAALVMAGAHLLLDFIQHWRQPAAAAAALQVVK